MIVDAAIAAFAEQGYVGATMETIAQSAGVAVATIYRSFDGKAGLLKAAVEAAVESAIAADGTVGDRPAAAEAALRAVIDERDPRRKIERYAETQPATQARLAPLYRTLTDAAAAQPQLSTLREALELGRLEGMARFARHLEDAGALRVGLSVDDARDVLWTINSHAVYRMLVTERGWSPRRYGDWLAAMLVCALLGP